MNNKDTEYNLFYNSSDSDLYVKLLFTINRFFVIQIFIY